MKSAFNSPSENKIQRLAFFTESNPRPVVEINLQGKIIYKNPSAKEMLPDLKKTQHPYLSDFKKIIKILSKKKSEYFNRDIKIDKRWFRQFFYYVPHFNSIIVYGSNVTALKNAEEKQRREEEAKNNFISILSHELRNPLTPILANAQFINFTLDKDKKADPLMIKELVSVIENQAKIMAELLNDILDVAKLNLKKIELRKRKIDISEPIKNSIKACMPFINMKEQKLSAYFSKYPIYVNADPLRIEQIMINLISNASKYTEEKGTIEIHCRSNNGSVQITVKDNGAGMNPKKISRIFDLFNTEGQSFMGSGGLGIGLNIVKNLTLMHGGTIQAKSKGKNKGSEFIVTLQRLMDKKVKELITLKKQKVKEGKKEKDYKNTGKVLIVEDNKYISSIIAKILNQKGYEVKTSNKGLPAVKISESFKPDVALIDIGLPDISGYKVAKMLSESKGNKKIKLIAMTGYGQQKDKILAKQAGFDKHVIKPVDMDNLLRLLS